VRRTWKGTPPYSLPFP